MDCDDIRSEQAVEIINELNDLIIELKEKGLRISSWYGRFDLEGDPNYTERINRGYNYKKPRAAVDDVNFPWFLYWEIIWVVLNGGIKSEHKILDLGGSSSLFSYYLSSKGCRVTTVDIKKDLVDNANFVADRMKWHLKNYVMDIRELDLDDRFDHITSICVFEHIPMYDRIEINRRLRKLLRNGGRVAFTFDYGNPSRFAKIRSAKDVESQFIESSGLKVRGNREFYDNGKKYLLNPFYYNNMRRILIYKVISTIKGHFGMREFFKTKNHNDYTFGALFLEK
jgi:2-polyprenyl-3-methyl-5-hydroxy-6-metoxy-1,4-benzoquinol methylase